MTASVEKEGDLARRERLIQLWSEQVSDRDEVLRDPGGKELVLAVRSLLRAARITERQGYAEAAEAALNVLGARLRELRAEVWPERLERLKHELAELDAAMSAGIDAELDNRAQAHDMESM